MKGKREENIDTFGYFKGALKRLFKYDEELLEMKYRKETVINRISLYMSESLEEGNNVDTSILGADLVIWDRKGNIDFALFLSKDYLSEEGKRKTRAFHLAYKPNLTLAFSILKEKDYVLIYRCEKDYVDYIHYYLDSFEDKMLKRVLLDEDSKEGLLFSSKKKTKS